MNSLKWTGERIIPEDGRYMFERHLKAYKFANNFCQNMKILDAGCGEGYGSCFISEKATEVVGIDISEEAVQHARTKYTKDNIKYEVMNVQNLQFKNDSFDVVLSFQVIEHLSDASKFLKEIKRVLKNNGMAIVGTPNKALCNGKDNGEYHLKEYHYAEYMDLLNSNLGPTKFYGVNIKSGKYSKLKLINLILSLDVLKIRHIFPYKFRKSTLMTMEKKIELEITNTKLDNALDIIGIYKKNNE
jgi:2-polyprenyl-3-methyl-5-hydroxy-6-metoxy-1,4-benzoquinol methylase